VEVKSQPTKSSTSQARPTYVFVGLVRLACVRNCGHKAGQAFGTIQCATTAPIVRRRGQPRWPSFKEILYKDNEDYVRGYREGRAAYNDACEKAQEHYGATLSVLRVQDPQEETL